MNRRVDIRTAELVDVALLTKEAFGLETARRFLELREIDTALMREVLEQPRALLRSSLTYASSACEGRRVQARG